MGRLPSIRSCLQSHCNGAAPRHIHNLQLLSFRKKKALQLLPSPVHVQSLLNSALLWNTRSSTTYKLNYVTIYISAVTAIGTRVVSDYFFGRKYAIKDVIYGCDDFCLITEPRTVLHFMDVAQVTRCLLFYLFFF
jgi:hypothetical protein